jgi:hypothetical protein
MKNPKSSSVTRESIIAVFSELPAGTETSTRRIAARILVKNFSNKKKLNKFINEYNIWLQLPFWLKECDQMNGLSPEYLKILDKTERAVRAAISWLVMGGQLKCVGYSKKRRDSEGRKYPVKLYKWTGKKEIFRVPQDEEERKISIEQRSFAGVTAFLCKPW